MIKRLAAKEKIAIYCLLDPILHSKIEKNCKTSGLSKSEYIRAALRLKAEGVEQNVERSELGMGTR